MGRNEVVNDDNPSRPLVLSDGSTFDVSPSTIRRVERAWAERRAE